MMSVIVAVLFTVANLATQPAACGPSIRVIQNGLNHFAGGVVQIGPYTDPAAYFVDGLAYIQRACGVAVDPGIFENRP
ncbi:MAG: hypothetical protein K8L99_18245 [Anaerolineae bacterium]|nr:hypothetical protein [Anaerolineae bacterium]